MQLAAATLSLALASSARAFSPAARASSTIARGAASAGAFVGGPRRRTMSASTTALGANVLKLTEPAKDLLPGVDVFIFDCDGVIWRVSAAICNF